MIFLYFVLGVQFIHGLTLEALAVIDRDGLRDAESVYDLDVNKLRNCHRRKVSDCDSFGPFRDVVRSD